MNDKITIYEISKSSDNGLYQRFEMKLEVNPMIRFCCAFDAIFGAYDYGEFGPYSLKEIQGTRNIIIFDIT